MRDSEISKKICGKTKKYRLHPQFFKWKVNSLLTFYKFFRGIMILIYFIKILFQKNIKIVYIFS
ncbi:hypothetical protein ABD67_22225 [Bacillus sonorensis]|nr:hypothetical protein [Bacillus sonorensis]TWK73809.1 hypothetical protein CHCC20335_2094 [Bacillus paralicheniformis]GIN68842.1 hypothetical protein J41TS2_42630 [Bacillus sonorensis]